MKPLAWIILIFFAILAFPFMLVGFTWRLMCDGFEVGTVVAKIVGEWLEYHTGD